MEVTSWNLFTFILIRITSRIYYVGDTFIAQRLHHLFFVVVVASEIQEGEMC